MDWGKLDEWEIDQREIGLEEKYMSLVDKIWDFVEDLIKSKCVRCSNSVSGGTKGSRCLECRKKLNAARQTPGHAERAQNKAQQAIRRENHGNGTATPKSKGKAESNAKLAAKMQRAEKKTGQKLSPDRKDNGSGYHSKNTRAVPEKLNRGRHEVDSKKLKNWKKRLKKSQLTDEELATLVAIKALEQNDQ
jgi:hypothetical protein